MELDAYRAHPREQARIASLMSMVPSGFRRALDVGARDGYLSRRLADLGAAVTALDLELPQIDDPRIECVKGNAAKLPFDDGTFDLVLCAEVLEHIPEPMLTQVCGELARVSAAHLLIGVPYRQDIRVGRLTCGVCGGISPPWGHVNSFDEAQLLRLFPNCRAEQTELVGVGGARTNALSARLMDMAGNPWGTYDQEEPCIHCGSRFSPPAQRNITQKVLAKTAVLVNRAQRIRDVRHANWVHVLLRLPAVAASPGR